MRLSIENALHRKAFLISKLDDQEQQKEIQKLLILTFEMAKEDFCAKATTVAIIQDVFDTISIKKCEKLFFIIEDNLSQWKTALFYEPCKNMILRMCNDLLKRLSRTIDTSFCGRILVLLARALPLCEKSGLNLVSHFNSDNITKYDSIESPSVDANITDVDMETGEIQENRYPYFISLRDLENFAFYKRFWQLQTFFSTPLLLFCFFIAFIIIILFQNTTEVFNVLSSYKLDDISEGKNSSISPNNEKKINDAMDTGIPFHSTSSKVENENFFAKYLTSQKLLQLQLNDSRFRRYFLVQCLILYQYLVSDIKFKDKSYTLNDEQLRYIIESTDKCYKLLREIHPNGILFANSVKAILQREKEWSDWKNKGCPDYTVSADKDKMSPYKKKPRNKYDPSKIDLGNPELTKLWNINPNMLEACHDRKRKFVPCVADFIADPLDELDPEQQVEDQYKAVNNELFQWRCSRLLLQESPLYFQIPLKKNEVTTNMAPFLEELIKKTSSNFQRNNIANDGVHSNLAKKKYHGSETAQNGICTSESSPLISEQHIQELAPLLVKDWRYLAKVLGFKNDVIDSYAALEPSNVIKTILKSWCKSEGQLGTVKKLSSLLLTADLFSEKVGSIFKAVKFNLVFYF
ncbi:unnamed protein product [Dracunculus medinensis]|uniref:Death domain-containing protein n=1 Tax=Dracunculus medinensis TaxID=318479 RepID=A0A0N4UIH1_DRAME|nr:unnamed protein product [Dracunculus medinensis]